VTHSRLRLQASPPGRATRRAREGPPVRSSGRATRWSQLDRASIVRPASNPPATLPYAIPSLGSGQIYSDSPAGITAAVVSRAGVLRVVVRYVLGRPTLGAAGADFSDRLLATSRTLAGAGLWSWAAMARSRLNAVVTAARGSTIGPYGLSPNRSPRSNRSESRSDRPGHGSRVRGSGARESKSSDRTAVRSRAMLSSGCRGDMLRP
jgi:hypothetical protein